MSKSCKSISDKEITRVVIKLLEGKSFNPDKWKVIDILEYLAKKFSCNLGSKDGDEYKRFRSRVKKAVKMWIGKEDNPDDWNDFKKKYKKKSASPKLSPPKRKRSQSPKRKRSVSPKRKQSSSPKASSKSPKRKPFSFPKPIKQKTDIYTSATSPILTSELASLSSVEVQTLAQMCLDNKPAKDIQKALSAKGITRLDGISIYKYKKADLCNVLTRASPSVSAPVASIQDTSAWDPTKCETRQNTVASLLSYISDQGWPAPAGKDKKTKGAICTYISSKTGTPIPPPSPVSMDGGLDDLENCDASRKLAIARIQSFAADKGWNKRADAPKPKDKKAAWCAWIKARITESKTKVTMPKPTYCLQKDAWLNSLEAEADLTCPNGQVCNTEIKQCTPSASIAIAAEAGMSQMDLPLKGGKSITIYGRPDNLQTLKERVNKFKPDIISSRQQACGTRTSGSAKELIKDALCDDPNQICNISTKQCADLNTSDSNLIKFNFRGNEIIGTKDDIDSFEKRLSGSVPAGAPTTAQKAKLAFKKKLIVYGAEQQREQADAARQLSALVGEPLAEELPIVTPPDDGATLQSASLHGHLPTVEFLVSKGVDIHTINKALQWASEKGHLPVVEFLVSKGADIHTLNDQALRWASENNRLPVVEFLVSKGANIHAMDNEALRLASYNGHLSVVEFLVSNGANIHAQNDYALKWANKKGYLPIVKFLESKRPDEKVSKKLEVPVAVPVEPVVERAPSEVARLVSRLQDIQVQRLTTPVKLMAQSESIASKISLCTGISS